VVAVRHGPSARSPRPLPARAAREPPGNRRHRRAPRGHHPRAGAGHRGQLPHHHRGPRAAPRGVVLRHLPRVQPHLPSTGRGARGVHAPRVPAARSARGGGGHAGPLPRHAPAPWIQPLYRAQHRAQRRRDAGPKAFARCPRLSARSHGLDDGQSVRRAALPGHPGAAARGARSLHRAQAPAPVRPARGGRVLPRRHSDQRPRRHRADRAGRGGRYGAFVERGHVVDRGAPRGAPLPQGASEPRQGDRGRQERGLHSEPSFPDNEWMEARCAVDRYGYRAYGYPSWDQRACGRGSAVTAGRRFLTRAARRGAATRGGTASAR
jgi:hypothetical protein